MSSWRLSRSRPTRRVCAPSCRRPRSPARSTTRRHVTPMPWCERAMRSARSWSISSAARTSSWPPSPRASRDGPRPGRAGGGSGMTAADGPGLLARVVIAEDEAIVRLDLKEILVTAGYDVVGETGRGDEAVTLVEQHQPDLAILDVKMPGMDGIRAAREITSHHKVAVLLLTAFSQRDLIEEARDSGVSAYLIKPFQPRDLLPAIADVLAKARQDWAIDEEAQHSSDG